MTQRYGRAAELTRGGAPAPGPDGVAPLAAPADRAETRARTDGG